MSPESQQAAPGPADAWKDFLAHGGRFDAMAEMQRVRESRAWNRKMFLGGCVLIAFVVAIAIVQVAAGVHPVSLLTLGAMTLILGVGLVPRLLLLRNQLDLSIDESGSVISVSSSGIMLAGFPSIRWSELAALTYLDRSLQDEKLSTLPIVGFGPRWMRRAGEGSHIHLDTLLDDETRSNLLAVVQVAVEGAGIPFAASTKGLEHIKSMSKLLNPA